MMTSIKDAMLVNAMGFAWHVVRSGESSVERSEAIGITDPEKPYSGLLERMATRKAWATVRAGERLEAFVNSLAMKLGYRDGEVSGIVAWPSLAC
jgi:hypothetical protein